LPTVGNTHEVVQQVAPDARVVYVDNDPLVRLHSEALLADTSTIKVILGDLRDPEGILGDPGLREADRFRRANGPCLMTGVMMFRGRRVGPLGTGRTLCARTGARQLSVTVAPQRRPQVPRRAVQGFRTVFDTATRTALLPLGRPRWNGSSPGWNWCHRTRAPSRVSLMRGIWGAEDVAMGGHRRLPVAVVRSCPASVKVSRPQPGRTSPV